MINLPELILFNDYPSSEVYLDTVYSFFKSDFLENKVWYQNQAIFCDATLENNKAATFWHIVTNNLIGSGRPLDINRSARIRWPKPIIEGHEDEDVRVWENIKKDSKGKNQKRIYFCFGDWEYLVILEKRIDKLVVSESLKYYLIIFTAFPVDEDWYKKKLNKEYCECL